jgi:type VI secretion system protein ImpH
MADDGRPTPHALSMQTAAVGGSDLYQLLRRLEARLSPLPRIGRAARFAQDRVRLGQAASLAFAPGPVASVQLGIGDAPTRVKVHCFGLLGPNGPLPLHMTEYVWQRLKHHADSSLASFFDLFHHRMLSFFYRAWADAEPAVQRDRPELDRFGIYVACLFGVGTPAMSERDALPDAKKRFYAGQLADQVRHADGLRVLLEDHLGMPVCIEEFVGEWCEIPDRYQWRLGQPGSGQQADGLGQLGLSTSLGNRVWLRQGKFRVQLGPLSMAQFARVAPGGAALASLVSLVRGYAGDALSWDLRLQLEHDAITALQLGQAVLGQTAWLRGEKHAPKDDLLFDPQAIDRAR